MDSPPTETYRFWRNFENLPRFMNNVESVTITGEERSHWVVRGPAGIRVEWDAEIHNEVENEMVAWRSLENADVNHAGSVHFEPAGSGTQVRVVLNYEPPSGKAGAAIAKLFGEAPERQIEEDLQRFKQVMELGQVTEAQTSLWVSAQAPDQTPIRNGCGGFNGWPRLAAFFPALLRIAGLKDLHRCLSMVEPKFRESFGLFSRRGLLVAAFERRSNVLQRLLAQDPT